MREQLVLDFGLTFFKKVISDDVDDGESGTDTPSR